MTTVQDPRPEAGQAPQDRPTFDVHHPGTGDLVGTWPVQSAAEVEDTVARARLAAEWWQGIGYAERRKRLDAFRGVIARRIHQLAHLVHDEMGKPHSDAFLEVALVLDHLAWAGKHAPKVLGQERRSTGLINANLQATVEHHPLGVIGVIGPWNYPVFTPMGSIVYALAGGNAVVFKPSEFTPGVGAWLVNAFAEVVPEHPVLQLVTGDGSTGAALCRAGVDKVAFTGSTATAKRVMATCAETLTPIVAECGGKDALIVDKDADLAAAADGAVWGGIANAGQTCIGVERIYVHQDVAAELARLLVERFDDLRAGADPAAAVGPITMPSQVRIIDPESGQPCPDGTPGELQFRGGGAFKSYYADPEATAATILADGWVRTGDRGRIDENGFLVFLGRIKDMLKVGGENVAAAEIEAFIQGLPGVQLVQVIGMADDRMGEVPVAFIEPSGGAELSAQGIIEACDGQLARWKIPRRVEFVSEWPMSATKVQKFRLAELL